MRSLGGPRRWMYLGKYSRFQDIVRTLCSHQTWCHYTRRQIQLSNTLAIGQVSRMWYNTRSLRYCVRVGHWGRQSHAGTGSWIDPNSHSTIRYWRVEGSYSTVYSCATYVRHVWESRSKCVARLVVRKYNLRHFCPRLVWTCRSPQFLSWNLPV